MSCRRCYGPDSGTTDLCDRCLQISIPLRAGDRVTVRAYAWVDAEDYDRLTNTRWCLHSRGYAMRNTAAGAQFLHREVMRLHRGDGLMVDHINGNRLDNRKANLRLADHALNGRNRHGLACNNKSGATGVFRVPFSTPNPWCAQIRVAGRGVHLGLFPTVEEAARARRDAERLYFEEDAA